MTPEILAPVGGKDQLEAAIRAGADAVYLGTQSFNARRNAANFTSDELPDVVSSCHRAGVRVHVTFNTLLADRELPDALQEIGRIAGSGADAVIVQDIGAAKLFREYCPRRRSSWRSSSTALFVFLLPAPVISPRCSAEGVATAVSARDPAGWISDAAEEVMPFRSRIFPRWSICRNSSGSASLPSRSKAA